MRKSNEKTLFDENTEHNRSATLFGLPTEILLKISRHFPAADAARAGRACKASHAIAHTTPVKEKIQLARAETIQVAAGRENTFIWRNFPSSCVLLAVGENQYGKLGTGDTLARETFTQIQLPRSLVRIIQVAAGDHHTVIYGIDAKGNSLIATCGWNKHGQLGNGDATDYLDPNLFPYAADEQKLLARDMGGIPMNEEQPGWMHEYVTDTEAPGMPCSFHEKKFAFTKPGVSVDGFSLIQLPKNLVRVSQVAASGSHTIVSGTDAVGNPIFSAAGCNNYGHLGSGGREYPKTLSIAQLPVKFIKMLQVGTGQDHMLISGVNDEGRPFLIACGDNSYGQLGTGDVQNRNRFTSAQLPPEFVSVNQVIAARNYSVVLGEDAENRPLLASCGINRNSELGTGDNLERNTLTLVMLPEDFVYISQVVVGDRCTAVVGRDIKDRPLLAACGLNRLHQFGVRDYHYENIFALVELPLAMAKLDQIVIGKNSALISGTDTEGAPLLAMPEEPLVTDNRKWKDTYTFVELPKSFSKVIHVDAGDEHYVVYGMDAEGGPLLATRGENRQGQLGTGDNKHRNGFTLIPLPECLQSQFHVLPENEKEQHDNDPSEESFARHNF